MDIHQIITALVGAIQPHDDLEREHIADVLAWAATDVPLCRSVAPATPPKHLVSYFVLYDQPHGKVLLVDHKKAGLWLPSGGHVEPGEHPRATVEREVREELGITAQFWQDGPLFITVTRTVGSTAGHIDVSLWYVLRGDSTVSVQYDAAEFHSVAWFGLDALPHPRTDPHMARFAAKLSGPIDG